MFFKKNVAELIDRLMPAHTYRTLNQYKQGSGAYFPDILGYNL